MAAFLAGARRAGRPDRRTSEDVVVGTVGRELYEKFFRGYTRKQWGLDPSELDAVGDRARADAHQRRRPLLHRHASRRCPRDGYTAMFERMLDHPRHRGAHRRRLPRRSRTSSTRHADLHRARSTSTSAIASASCPTARCASSSRPSTAAGRSRSATVNYPDEQPSLHPHHRVQAPHRPGAPAARRSSASTRPPRATRTTRSRGRRTPRCTSGTRRWREADAGRACSSAGWRTYRYYNMDQVMAQALTSGSRRHGRRAATASRVGVHARPGMTRGARAGRRASGPAPRREPPARPAQRRPGTTDAIERPGPAGGAGWHARCATRCCGAAGPRTAAAEGTDWRWADRRLERLRGAGHQPVRGAAPPRLRAGRRRPAGPGLARAVRRVRGARRPSGTRGCALAAHQRAADDGALRRALRLVVAAPHRRGRVRAAAARRSAWASARAARADPGPDPGRTLVVNEDAGVDPRHAGRWRPCGTTRAARWLTFDLLTGRVVTGLPGAGRRSRRCRGPRACPGRAGRGPGAAGHPGPGLLRHQRPLAGPPSGGLSAPSSTARATGPRYVDVEAVRVAGVAVERLRARAALGVGALPAAPGADRGAAGGEPPTRSPGGGRRGPAAIEARRAAWMSAR